jgi:hypothetical protein
LIAGVVLIRVGVSPYDMATSEPIVYAKGLLGELVVGMIIMLIARVLIGITQNRKAVQCVAVGFLCLCEFFLLGMQVPLLLLFFRTI